MWLDKRKYIKIAKRYAKLVREQIPVTMVVLYGSSARGTSGTSSDIDIEVIVDQVEGDLLTTSATLFKLGWEIDSRIEPVLVKQGDDTSGFYSSIMEHGIVVYRDHRAAG